MSLCAGVLGMGPFLRRRPPRAAQNPHHPGNGALFTPSLLGAQYDWAAISWPPGDPSDARPPRPGDLPRGVGDGENSSMFNKRRQLTQKAAALDPRLRCTEVDELGNAILVDGEFKKSELIARVGGALLASCMVELTPV